MRGVGSSDCSERECNDEESSVALERSRDDRRDEILYRGSAQSSAATAVPWLRVQMPSFRLQYTEFLNIVTIGMRFTEALLMVSPTPWIIICFLGLFSILASQDLARRVLAVSTSINDAHKEDDDAQDVEIENEPDGDIIHIRPNEVPQYLHLSLFYLALDPEDTDDIAIPASCFAADDFVTNARDLAQLLRVMVFWGLDVIPDSVLQFCEITPLQAWEKIAGILGDNGTLHSILTTYFKNRWSIAAAIASGHNEIVYHWLRMNPPNSTYGASATAQVAETGDLELLVEMHTVRGYPWNSKSSYAAAKRGHLRCLQYMVESKCDIHPTCCEVAAVNGHFDCFIFLHRAGCSWDETKTRAVGRAENIEFLRYTQQQGIPFPPNITRSTDVECLRYALQNGVTIDADTFLDAMATFDIPLECLELLREYGAPWDERACDVSITRDVTYLQYLMENNCPYSDTLVASAARANRIDHLKYLVSDCLLAVDDNVLFDALLFGSFECVQYLVDVGFLCVIPVQYEYYSYTFDDDKMLPCLQYVAEHGWTLDNQIFLITGCHDLPACWDYLRTMRNSEF